MAKTTGKEIAKNAIENQIDFVLNHSSGDTQRGIAYGMIDLAERLQLISNSQSQKYNKQLEIH